MKITSIVSRRTTTRTKFSITAADIRERFNLDESTKLSITVPGGGDWSNTELDLDEYPVEGVRVEEDLEEFDE